MPRTLRLGSAVSAVALAAMLAGCSTPNLRSAGLAGGKAGSSKLAFATRAQVAIASGDFTTAVDLAEQAVENSPSDPMLRALLGNAYFGAGRFASAEAAYQDSLALQGHQPQLVLKLALVQIAQGRKDSALALLEAARAVLDPADHGLALALAGHAGDAVLVLEQAARVPGADARVRQNLALAYGLAGDWGAARTVAGQDLSPDLVDARVQQWMALAKPDRASDQVAALVGVTPVAADPGQPVRLALRRSEDVRLAEAPVHPSPLAQPDLPLQPAEQNPVSAMAAQVPPAFQAVEQQAAAPAVAVSALTPLQVAEPLPAAPELSRSELPVLPELESEKPLGALAGPDPAGVSQAFAERPAVEAVSAPILVPAQAEPGPPPPLVAALTPAVKAPKAKERRISGSNGNAGVVVQLGAYSSPARVEAAWEQFAGRYRSLRDYSPASARFQSPKGTVYRLSIKGFATLREASSLCSELRGQGQNCFVRRLAGDAPVQFASR